MPSSSRCRVLVRFLIALGMLFLSGCDKPVNLVLGQNHKIALNPTPGQHLVWGNGIKVQFLGVTPCSNPPGADGWLSDCVVKSDLNPGTLMQFFYICKDYGCSDPEVDVGSGIGVDQNNQKSKTNRVTDSVGVYCTGTTVTLAPPDLPSTSQPAPLVPGIVVNWVSVGGLTDWKVVFETPSPCDEASIQSDGNTMCTIKKELAPKKYTYAASSTTCATPAPGSLTTAVSVP